MNHSRRGFLSGLAAFAGVSSAGVDAAAQRPTGQIAEKIKTAKASPPTPPVPVVTPDLKRLPFTTDNGVKVFRLIAEPVKSEIMPGRALEAWGFNGSVPGPMIEVNEGDRVRIVVENHLPEVFAPHWHGLEVPIGMDGTPGISQAPIKPGESFTYEFTLHQNGTFFYHSHMPMQEMMGMIGLFVVHPSAAHTPRVDRDFAYVIQEWMLQPYNNVPNTLAMEFNWLTLNGKSGPAATPMVVRQGERVRIRMVNMGMDHHPMHLHGHQFHVTGTEAGRAAEPFTMAQNTVIVGVAQARDIEFVATNPGDWMFHCHFPHHMMNQMVSMVGPAMVDPADPSAKVPGFPQDMWMPMDDAAGDKPEVLGLPENWTGAMMGMMTLVRVVSQEQWDAIERRRARMTGGAR